jgi:hypothetical protein
MVLEDDGVGMPREQLPKNNCINAARQLLEHPIADTPKKMHNP